MSIPSRAVSATSERGTPPREVEKSESQPAPDQHGRHVGQTSKRATQEHHDRRIGKHVGDGLMRLQHISSRGAPRCGELGYDQNSQNLTQMFVAGIETRGEPQRQLADPRKRAYRATKQQAVASEPACSAECPNCATGEIPHPQFGSRYRVNLTRPIA